MTNNEQALQQLPEQIIALFQNGGTLGMIQGFDEKDYEALYALGHSFYSNTRYQDAAHIFNYLVTNNHLEKRYMNAYASSLQMCGEYRQAITCYSMASLMDIDDPLPTFHSAECLLALNMRAEANEALEIVFQQCDAPQYAELKTQALALQALQTTAVNTQKE